MRMLLDLHTHSAVSDGSLTPSALARRAARLGVGALSLTDHDSTDGLEEAEEEAAGLGMEFVRGCEISSVSAYGGVDVLGYYTPRRHPELESALARLRAARARRNSVILERLAALGLPVSEEEVRMEGGQVFGRPHIAAAMLRKGQVRRLRDAYTLYLGRNKPAYAPKEIFPVEEAVSLLARVGASPFIAHPLFLHAPESALEALIRRLIPLGLTGIEAYHSEHGPAEEQRLLALAVRNGILVSGGSDFHGAAKPEVELGRGRGGLLVPEAVLETLKKHRRERGLPV